MNVEAVEAVGRMRRWVVDRKPSAGGVVVYNEGNRYVCANCTGAGCLHIRAVFVFDQMQGR